MAEVSHSPTEVLLSRRVQEISLNDDEKPPPPYICRDELQEEEDDGAEKGNHPTESSPIPVVDVANFISSKSHPQELDELKAALSSWGCFQAIGHGISSSLLDEVRHVARKFFALPMDEKKKYEKKVADFEGYGGDPAPEEGQPLDWSDRIFLTVHPEHERKYQFWPTNPQSFRHVMVEYTDEMKRVTGVLSKAMAKSLNLEEDCFMNQFGEGAQFQLRFNYYSKCRTPHLVLGLKPHADGSGFTIIIQDEVGLQVLKDGEWFKVPNIPHALLVVLGDQMEIMSNGIFKSPVHRVLTSSERDRISVAMFYYPEVGSEVEPEDGLVNEENPKLFKKIKDYGDIHIEYYQRGMRALDFARV